MKSSGLFSFFVLIFLSFNLQASIWDCKPEPKQSKNPLNWQACFEGEKIIFDIHGNGTIDKNVRAYGCSSGTTFVGQYCGLTGDNGGQHELCRRGLVQVCRFCPKKERADLDKLATILNVDLVSLESKCHAIQNTPANAKKAKLSCGEFVNISQGLKARFVDVVNAFDNLIYNIEKQLKGSSSHAREFLIMPKVVSPLGYQGQACEWEQIPNFKVKEGDSVTQPKISESTPSKDMIIVDKPTLLAFRPGFSEASHYELTHRYFKQNMFAWVSDTGEVIRGRGGFLETLDRFGFSPTVSKVREQIVQANRFYDKFVTISLNLSEDNFDEWKAKALEIKRLYLEPYKNDVSSFYYKPQKSSKK